MQIILGTIFALLLLATGAHVARVYRDLKAAGVLTPPPKTGSRPERIRSTVRRSPETMRMVITRGIVEDWKDRRAHRRAAAPKGPKRSVLERLVMPGGRPAPAVPAPRAPGESLPGNVRPLPRKTAGGDVPQQPAPQAQPRSRPQPVPDPPSGRTTPVTTGTTSSASDMFAAVSVVVTQATAGGIRAKARAVLTLSEGCSQQAAALEQFARQLADAEYPPMVWEPLTQAAAHMRASSVACSESQFALATILAMPARDLAASSIRVPHNSEFNKD